MNPNPLSNDVVRTMALQLVLVFALAATPAGLAEHLTSGQAGRENLGFVSPPSSIAPAGAPLRGEEAVAAVKREGIYDSIKAAYLAAQYQLDRVQEDGQTHYQARNPRPSVARPFHP